jgi:hypothetical protein
VKKFFDSTLGLGFTLSGAVVMYFTLSGFTQKVALVATLIALIAHYWLVFKEPDA